MKATPDKYTEVARFTAVKGQLELSRDRERAPARAQLKRDGGVRYLRQVIHRLTQIYSMRSALICC